MIRGENLHHIEEEIADLRDCLSAYLRSLMEAMAPARTVGGRDVVKMKPAP